ncbi:PIN domain [Micractinium conductrix]|uniref:PIN domain n=1 Tax=Micractinium conductrix TaxID=554055 RepID=A0A2P6VD80_9CHLO|nr:PIN domain [Micractinium conductrix]|eukprot:PSC72044.1 PIN domain [Micractinium conductrix]
MQRGKAQGKTEVLCDTTGKVLEAALRNLADCLEREGEVAPRLLQTAADTMAEGFMRSRLPPHPAQLPQRWPAPTLQDSVQCVGADLSRLLPFHTKGLIQFLVNEKTFNEDCVRKANGRINSAKGKVSQPLPATTMAVCNAGLNMVPANRLLMGLTGRRVRVYKAGASPSPFRRVVHAVLAPISPSPATSPAAPNLAFGASVKLGTGPRRAHLVVALGVAGVWAVLCANPLDVFLVLSSCAAAVLFAVNIIMYILAKEASIMDAITTSGKELSSKLNASTAELRTAINASNAELRAAINASNADMRTAINASNADMRAAIDAVGTSVANLRTDVAKLQGKTEVLCDTTGKVLEAALRKLPPHPAQLPQRWPAPTLQDSVQCVGADLSRLLPFHTKGLIQFLVNEKTFNEDCVRKANGRINSAKGKVSQPLPATTMAVCNAGLNMVPANRLLMGLTGRRVRVYKAGASPSPFRRVVHAVLAPISPSPATSPAAPNLAFGASVKLGTGPRRAHLVVALGVAGVWAVLCANPLDVFLVLSSCAAAVLFAVNIIMYILAKEASIMDAITTSGKELSSKLNASTAELRTAINASNAELRAAINASNADMRTAINASNADMRAAIDAVGTSVANLRTDVAKLQGKTEVLCDTTGKVLEAALRKLPPHPAQLPQRWPAPTLQDSVQCVGADLSRLLPFHTKGLIQFLVNEKTFNEDCVRKANGRINSAKGKVSQPLPATTMAVCNAGLNMVPANRLLMGLTGRRVRVYKAGASPSPFRRVVHAVLAPISPSPATSPAAPNLAFGASVKLGTGPRRAHLVVALGVAGVWAVRR